MQKRKIFRSIVNLLNIWLPFHLHPCVATFQNALEKDKETDSFDEAISDFSQEVMKRLK